MKNKTQIAKELRDMGYKFTQSNFTDYINQVGVIEFEHNHVVLYADNTPEVLIQHYKMKTSKATEPDTPATVIAITPDQLTSIQKMLEAICKDLGVTVPA